MDLVIPKDANLVKHEISNFLLLKPNSRYSRAGLNHIVSAIFYSAVNILIYPIEGLKKTFYHICTCDLTSALTTLCKTLINTVLSVLTIPVALIFFTFSGLIKKSELGTLIQENPLPEQFTLLDAKFIPNFQKSWNLTNTSDSTKLSIFEQINADLPRMDLTFKLPEEQIVQCELRHKLTSEFPHDHYEINTPEKLDIKDWAHLEFDSQKENLLKFIDFVFTYYEGDLEKTNGLLCFLNQASLAILEFVESHRELTNLRENAPTDGPTPFTCKQERVLIDCQILDNKITVTHSVNYPIILDGQTMPLRTLHHEARYVFNKESRDSASIRYGII